MYVYSIIISYSQSLSCISFYSRQRKPTTNSYSHLRKTKENANIYRHCINVQVNFGYKCLYANSDTTFNELYTVAERLSSSAESLWSPEAIDDVQRIL